MLNTSGEPMRSSGREKTVTSIFHWTYGCGAIGEGQLIALEVRSDLPDDYTESLVDDHWDWGAWHKIARIKRSKQMKVQLGHYPQETITNEAWICIQDILCRKAWSMIRETPALKALWNYAQRTGGKTVAPDELLAVLLEENSIDDGIDGERYCNRDDPSMVMNWIPDALRYLQNGPVIDCFKKFYSTPVIGKLAETQEHDGLP